MPRRLSLLGLLVLGLTVGVTGPAFAGTESDDAIAADAVLTEDDVSTYGLTETQSSDSPPPNAPACKKIRAANKAADRAANAESEFGDSGGTRVGDKVIVFSGVKAAKAQIAAYSDAKAAKCLETTIKKSLEENLEPGSSSRFSGDKVALQLGDDGFVYTIGIEVTDPQGSVSTLYLEAGLIRVGRGVIEMDTFASDAPFPGSEDLATVLTDRLSESLGV